MRIVTVTIMRNNLVQEITCIHKAIPRDTEPEYFWLLMGTFICFTVYVD